MKIWHHIEIIWFVSPRCVYLIQFRGIYFRIYFVYRFSLTPYACKKSYNNKCALSSLLLYKQWNTEYSQWCKSVWNAFSNPIDSSSFQYLFDKHYRKCRRKALECETINKQFLASLKEKYYLTFLLVVVFIHKKNNFSL